MCFVVLITADQGGRPQAAAVADAARRLHGAALQVRTLRILRIAILSGCVTVCNITDTLHPIRLRIVLCAA